MSAASPGTEPTEFRYRDDGGREGAVWMLFVGVLFLLASVGTGIWAIASLLHASWLESGDLPAEDPTLWGVILLVVATIQGICGLLILFGRRLGTTLGITIVVIGILAHLAVIGAYPFWSIITIVVYLVILYLLVANRPRG
jgi:hypothetical protein